MPGRTIKKDGPHPVDVHVGSRVRQRRTLLGMSQETVADALDLTFQQHQKYEKGTNRISASRLFELSQILDVPVSFFYEDLPANPNSTKKEKAALSGVEFNPLTKRETLELVRAYYRIKEPAIQEQIRALAKALAES